MTPALFVISGSIMVALGVGHLILTYVGPKLLPRDRGLADRMRETELVITNQTSVWRAWIGFNVSHSLGFAFAGFVYSYLALVHPEILFASVTLQVVGLVFLAWFTALAKLYWFITPLIGVSLALVCFVLGMMSIWI